MGLQNFVQLQSEAADGLDPAEALVRRLAAECAAGVRVISGFVAFSNSSTVSLNSFRSSTTCGHQFVREAMRLDTEARGCFDQLRYFGEGSAPS